MPKAAAILALTAALVLAACECPCAKHRIGDPITPSTSTLVYPEFADSLTEYYYAEEAAHRAAANIDSGPTAAASPNSPEARILSLLHTSSMEEIRLAQLAQERSTSQFVREFAARLLNDHAGLDAAVVGAAQSASLSLLSELQTRQMMAREHGYITTPATRYADPVAELRAFSGPQFDQAFIRKMQGCHCDLIKTLETAEPTLKDRPTRDAVKRAITVLKDQDRDAKRLTF